MFQPAGRRLIILALVVIGSAALFVGRASANETVVSCDPGANEVFEHGAVFGISAESTCDLSSTSAGANLQLHSNANTVAAGQRATWQAVAPSGLTIDAVTLPGVSVSYVNDGRQYGGGFYWQGGGQEAQDSSGAPSPLAFGVANGTAGFPTPYFGLQLICGASPCTNSNSEIVVFGVVLDVAETTPPTLFSAKLWAQPGWVRGDWPLLIDGDSPSGLCSLSASVDGQIVATRSFPADTAAWHQCDAAGAGGLTTTVHTTQFADGSHQLTATGTDAAGLSPTANTATTIHIDNGTPVVTLSGPTDVPSTAGTQYVDATATAGPSGVDAITCRTDGGPAAVYPGATARIPVSGLGEHAVSCTASNNAVDGNGVHGTSAPAVWSMRIGTPTVAAIGFTRIVDGLRCAKATVRRTTPAHFRTVRRHHRRIRVRVRARSRSVRVVRCHPRTVRRRQMVTVVIRRHGHRVRVRRVRSIRVVLVPHATRQVVKVVRHGSAATVSGWLGTADGVALPGQVVQVLTAPDDGRQAFSLATTVTTAADGSWNARLPAGPGRLVQASYGGAPAAEPTTSSLAKLVVPARVQLLRVSPRRAAWGGTVRLIGRLAGGYLPPGGALVRLRIGLGSTYTTYGVHEHVIGSGRFSTTYTFGAGEAAVHRTFWFEIASLPMGDYPYAPASSRRMRVVVGGHPPAPPRRRRRP